LRWKQGCLELCEMGNVVTYEYRLGNGSLSRTELNGTNHDEGYTMMPEHDTEVYIE